MTTLPPISDLNHGTDEKAGTPPEEELARFFGYSHDVLVILDGGGRVLVVSPSVERVLGHSVAELVGRRLFSLVHPQDRPLVRSRLRPLADGEVVRDLDTRIRHGDGDWVPMRWSLATGRERRVYGVGRDRTAELERREALLEQEVSELRLRTAMELHDGILQTLTGASFQIAVARRLLRSDPEKAEQVLGALAESVSAEQQEMRLYVDEVKGSSAAWAHGSMDLGRRIRGMLERVSLIWGVEAKATVSVERRLSVETERQILRLVQEAAVNAARHGGAHRVSAEVHLSGEEIVIEIEDDGEGFPFLGEFDHATLQARRIGPLSLKQRVASVGGRLSIRSTEEGSYLRMRIPRTRGES